MNMNSEVIEKEIKWCEEHLIGGDDFEYGFIAGLRQALYLINQVKKVRHCTCKAGTGGHASWCELEKEQT